MVDCPVAERAYVVIFLAVYTSRPAMLIPTWYYLLDEKKIDRGPRERGEHTRRAFVTSFADLANVCAADPVSNLDRSNIGTNLLDNSDAFMTKNLRRVQEMLICSAKPGVCYFNIYFVILEDSKSPIFCDMTVFRPAVSFK
jgi:hypothetical protein